MRRALIVGIDDYVSAPLQGCVRDAHSVAATLEVNGDGSPNFDVRCVTSNTADITQDRLITEIDELFRAKADVALFYFSGHGYADKTGGTLVTQESPGIYGMKMTDLIAQANAAHPKIGSTVIILDCCHAGAAGEQPGMLGADVSAVGTGVIVLSASHKEGYAVETGGQGLFTSIFIEALRGSAADIRGQITPAAVYSLVDQTLGSWDQRPIFKANVQAFVSLRTVEPKVPLQTLRLLVDWFGSETSVFPLDPQFEPDRANIPESLRDLPRDPDKEAVFKQLQLCNRQGLVVPVDVEHMYDAAISSTGCKLTALGAHYRKLAELKRL